MSVSGSENPAIRAVEVSKQYRRTRAGFKLRTLKSALLQRSLTDGLGTEDLITAVQDVSFSVARGEAFGIIGGNGSGKSTLLKLVAGLMKPSSGKIDVQGRVAPLIELGAGFHPEISGIENIFINGAVLGLKRRQIEQRLDQIVAFSGLEEFIEEPVKNYSSGMYVRLGFAVAIHTQPQVLLVDEVLAVGDEAFAHKCIHRIEEHLASDGTLLFVSHSLGLVERLCDRVMWLDKGVHRGTGEPRQMIDAYRQAVAAEEAREHLESQGRQSVGPRQEDGEGSQLESDERAPLAGTESLASEDPDRWGSGEARIEKAAMLVDGQESYLLQSGGDMELVFDVEAPEPLEDFVFGIAISTPRGIECWGTNTQLLGLRPRSLGPKGTVRITCANLRLAAGEYDVDLAVHSRDGAPYDYRRRCLSFVVRSDEQGVGVYRPEHRWEFKGDVAWSKAGAENGAE